MFCEMVQFCVFLRRMGHKKQQWSKVDKMPTGEGST